MLALLLLSAAHACPSLDDALDRAITGMLSDDLDTARDALVEASDSLPCAAAWPTQLSRYYQYKGAYVWFKESHDAATPWLLSAHAADPSAFDARLGSELEAVFTSAEPPGSATLTLSPASLAYVDGHSVDSWPLVLKPGPHAVQVRSLDEQVLFGLWIQLRDGDDTTVETRLPPLAETVKARRRFPTFLVAGLVAGAGAGLSAWGATEQTAALHAACNDDPQCEGGNLAAFQTAARRGDLLSGATLALGALSVTGITLQFVLPKIRHDSALPGKVDVVPTTVTPAAPGSAP